MISIKPKKNYSIFILNKERIVKRKTENAKVGERKKILLLTFCHHQKKKKKKKNKKKKNYYFKKTQKTQKPPKMPKARTEERERQVAGIQK